LFRGAPKTLYPRWTLVWSRAFLNKKDTEPSGEAWRRLLDLSAKRQ
jgi:hypothetical protein